MFGHRSARSQGFRTVDSKTLGRLRTPRRPRRASRKKETARSGRFGFRKTIAVDHDMCGVQNFKQKGHAGTIGRLAFEHTEEPFEHASIRIQVPDRSRGGAISTNRSTAWRASMASIASCKTFCTVMLVALIAL